MVCSCTGYATPGLDILLARDLGMAPDTQRMFVGHMGCYAALPGLGAAGDFVTARGRPALLLCAELTSLHIQPPAARVDTQQIVSHALFSDAAVAAVVVRPGGRRVRAARGRLGHRHLHRRPHDLGRHRRRLPDGPVAEGAAGALAGTSAGWSTTCWPGTALTVAEVDGWAVHPGGPRILNVVEQRAGPAAEALAASRAMLAEHGNCSSPTVLLILDRLLPARAGRPDGL